MPTISKNNKRIAKNTLMLYIRMLIIMGVSLYTSRVVLQTLGIEDFGLYNIIGGVIVLFTILNGALSSSTQRFLNYAIGKGKENEVSTIFQSSITLHFILIGAILVLSETVGLWYLNNIMNVPPNRIIAANYIYQFSILSFCINVIRVPYNATIIAYEKMSFYAYISILEAALKLIIVYLLAISSIDRLIFYGFLTMIVSIVICITYIIYCFKKYPTIHFGFTRKKTQLQNMITFSGWNLFGSVAVVSSQQGIMLILNYFCGVALNASAGIANQMTNAMYGFISNFQTAFNPQIVKLYAKGETNEFFKLIFRASKFSYCLFWMISLPVLISTNTILELWLDNVPNYTVSFCRIIILYLLIDALNGPLWISVQATGKIKYYQIMMGSILILNIPIAWLLLYLNFSPELVWATRLFFNVIAMIMRWLYLKSNLNFPLKAYLRSVVLPIIFISIISFLIFYMIPQYVNNLLQVVINLIATLIVNSVLIYYFCLNAYEKTILIHQIKKIYSKIAC